MQNLNIDIVPGPYKQVIHYSQGDEGRQFVLNVVGFDIPVGATVKCVGTKPSGFGFTMNGTPAGNAVTFTLTDAETDEFGRFPAELVIESGGDVLGTANFYFEGEKNPHPDGTIDGQKGSVIPQLTLLVEAIENSNAKVESMTASASALSPDAAPTANYDPDTNNIAFGIPVQTIEFTDPNMDGNIIITIN